MLKLLKKHAGKITVLGLLCAGCIITHGITTFPLSSLVFTGFTAISVIAVAGGGMLYWVKKDEKRNLIEDNANFDDLNQSSRLILELKQLAEENDELRNRLNNFEQRCVVNELANKRTMSAFMGSCHERINTLEKSLNSSSSSWSSSRNSFFSAADNMVNDDNFDQDKYQNQTNKS